MFYLTCAPVVSTLLSSVFYNVVAITPPLMLHATLHHRDNIFLLQRFEDFCETLNKLAVRKKGRSTIYELQPNTNSRKLCKLLLLEGFSATDNICQRRIVPTGDRTTVEPLLHTHPLLATSQSNASGHHCYTRKWSMKINLLASRS